MIIIKKNNLLIYNPADFFTLGMNFYLIYYIMYIVRYLDTCLLFIPHRGF